MITIQSIRDAAGRIAPHVIRTPLVESPTFSEIAGAKVYLKLETLQKAGSFKIRGATNTILCNLATAQAHGVVAASAGNHAQGVAVAARRAGVAATIVMPVWASAAKQEATKGYGARVVLVGKTLEESVTHAQARAREGMLFVHPYDDEDVIAGQGTIGLEILEDLPGVDQIVVPVGGGGLIAGIALAARSQRPSCRVTGVQAAACPSVYETIRTGTPLCTLAQPTLADGIRVTQAGSRTLPLIREYVEHIALVEEDAIADAMLSLIERKKVIAEGAGAAPLAALLSGRIRVEPESTVVLVISGGNIDSPLLERVIRHALVLRGRILAVTIVLEDRPGALASLLALIAHEQGNILDIRHEPTAHGIPVSSVRIRLEIETRGKDHLGAVLSALHTAGFWQSSAENPARGNDGARGPGNFSGLTSRPNTFDHSSRGSIVQIISILFFGLRIRLRPRHCDIRRGLSNPLLNCHACGRWQHPLDCDNDDGVPFTDLVPSPCAPDRRTHERTSKTWWSSHLSGMMTFGILLLRV